METSSPPWKSRASALKARVAEEQSRLTSPSYGALHEKKQQQMPKKAATTPAATRRPSSPLPVASNSDDANPFLTVTIDRLDDRCPFLNPTVSFACRSGQTVWLRGCPVRISALSMTSLQLRGHSQPWRASTLSRLAVVASKRRNRWWRLGPEQALVWHPWYLTLLGHRWSWQARVGT